MANNTTTALGILRPEEVGPLVIEPLQRASWALQVSNYTVTASPQFRIPIITADAGASWVGEAQEIPVADAGVAELVVSPTKIGGISIISRELAEDSSPQAAGLIGDGLSRKIARTLDTAYFGAVQAAPAQQGLMSLSGVADVSAGAAWSNLDSFAEALSVAETVGATINFWVAHPSDVLALRQLKVATGWNQPLLTADTENVTAAPVRDLLGVPLLSCPAVVPGVVWGIPSDRCFVIMRDDTRIETFPAFTTDEVMIKATMRVGFAFPHEAAIVKISLSAT